MAHAMHVADIWVSLVHPTVGQVAQSRHDHHEIVLVDHGQYHVEVQGQRHCLSPGNAIFFPQGCPHHVHVIKDLSLRLWVLMWRGWIPEGWRAAFTIDDSDRRVLTSLAWLSDRIHLPVPTGLPFLESLLTALLCELAARQIAPGHIDDPLERARQMLAMAPQYHWSLRELAHHVGLSPSHLCRRFAGRYGEPPMAWVARRRLGVADALLQDGRWSRREVAATVGYADPASLDRARRRRRGRQVQA